MTRRILSLFAVAAVFILVAPMAHGQAPAPAGEHAASPVTPKEALERLKAGNARFVDGKRMPRDFRAQVAATAAGQHPFAAVVSCMDSRASAELVLDEGIGDVFSLRVAGNVIDPNFLGSLEYAAKVVGVRLILVMGHTECGAIKGAIDDVKLGNLTSLLAKIRPAVEATRYQGDRSAKNYGFVDAVARKNVELAMADIRRRSTVLAEVERAGTIKIAGAMYDLETAMLDVFQ